MNWIARTGLGRACIHANVPIENNETSTYLGKSRLLLAPIFSTGNTFANISDEDRLLLEDINAITDKKHYSQS